MVGGIVGNKMEAEENTEELICLHDTFSVLLIQII